MASMAILGGTNAMTNPRPPWQLTTSELAREIEALEVLKASGAVLAPDEGGREAGRLAQLYAERDGRKRLADHNLRTAERQRFDEVS